MSDQAAQQAPADETRTVSERDVERTTARLVERAPADSVEPALMQSGNPPRTFERPER